MSELKIEEKAQKLRDIWSLGEGPQVEQALYDYGVNKPDANNVYTLKSWNDALNAFHSVHIDDQFIPPLQRVDKDGKPVGTVKDGDAIIYFDFRTDRAKPLTSAFLDIPFGGQDGGLSEEARKTMPDVLLVTMTHYDDNFNKSEKLREAFNPAEPLTDTYTEVAGKAGIKQLVVAESEKWRAVTWFKDGRRNMGYEKHSEDGIVRTDKHPDLPITVRIVKSREVAAHIQAPQMRAKELADVLLEGIKEKYDDIFVNFANSDMVGHAMTDINKFDGVVEAILELDTQLGRVVPAALEAGYIIMITGDHGNAEQMIHPDGKANPAHTTNKVPFIVLGLDPEDKLEIDPDVTIGEMAPTCLFLRGLDQPASWDRKSLLRGNTPKDPKRPIFKIVLDGYGVHDGTNHNAMYSAAEKKGSALHMDRWMKGEDGALFTPAEASGERCGYPKGEAGTTEFGHVLFDAGRTVHSDVSLIDHALSTGEFEENKALQAAIQQAKDKNSTIHIMGITSDGQVHSSLNHLDGILRVLKKGGVNKDQVSLHPITDGRDVPGDSSPQYIKWLEDKIAEYGVGQINSMWGRGWGKDRDNRWKRIETAFRCLSEGTAAMHVRFE